MKRFAILLVATVALVGCGDTTNSSDQQQATASATPDVCVRAIDEGQASMKSAVLGNFRAGYVSAVSAERHASRCGSGVSPTDYNETQAAAAAIALTGKAMNEQFLPEGNSKTDKEIAALMFARCVNVGGSFEEMCQKMGDSLDGAMLQMRQLHGR